MEITCDYCGKTFEYKGGKSHYERCENHYCSRSCQGDGNNVKQGNKIHGLAKRKNNKQDKRYSIWCGAKKRAKLKGQEFDLQIEDIPEIPEYCPILHIKIIANKTNSPLDSSPSLDRIDSKKGYIKGNVQIISNRANRIKSDATIEEVEMLLKFMRSSK